MSLRIKISGKADPRMVPRVLTGQDLRVAAVDEQGVERLLPARSITIRCDGRKSFVTAEVELLVAELDVEDVGEGVVRSTIPALVVETEIDADGRVVEVKAE